MSDKKLSTEPYKGTRDFYPKDWAEMQWLFSICRKAVESFGYLEYNASILEPAELYRAKTGEEIVNEQTYTFGDRGDREVTLRPEMTPTLARMVAARRRDLSFPLRWYSIPNLFRYERLQRGRLREHYQLNCDLLGIVGIEAEEEIITLSYRLLKALGANDNDFVIKVNYAGAFGTFIATELQLSEVKANAFVKVLDRMGKISEEELNKRLNEIAGPDKKRELEEFYLNKKLFHEKMGARPEVQELSTLKKQLKNSGIEIEIDPFLTRGFDYYTGVVFEIFDRNPENRRSLFGGGRYDNLLELFGGESVPAVGFGMGDVTIRDFLEVRGLLPAYRSPIDLYLCRVSDVPHDFVNETAEKLRAGGLNVAVELGGRKVGAQIEAASKQGIPFVVCLGKDEMESGEVKMKELETGEETELSIEEVPSVIKGKREER